MEAVCSGPLRVGSLVWQARPGAYVFTVACKATYHLLPGESRLAAAAANVLPFDVHAARDERASLAAPSDLVPFKVRPELILTGHARAPGGRPVHELLVRVATGEMDKILSVHGDRYFSPAGDLLEAVPFTRMPLVWERAAGGADTPNPAGVPTGPDARPDLAGCVPLPNLQPIGRFFPTRADVVAPACFAPIAATWPTRRAYLGHHAATWDPLRWRERPLPPDLAGEYFQAAPADQWVNELPVGIRLFLENLHPQIPQLTTRLPNISPVAVVEVAGSSSSLPLRCDTLLIDADNELATLVYRASVPLDHPHREGRVVVTPAPSPSTVAVPATKAVSATMGLSSMPAVASVSPPVSASAPAAGSTTMGLSSMPAAASMSPPVSAGAPAAGSTTMGLSSMPAAAPAPMAAPQAAAVSPPVSASAPAAAPVAAAAAPAPAVAPASEPVYNHAVKQTQIGSITGGPALPFEAPSSEIAAMVASLPPEMQAKMAARLAALGEMSGVSVSGTVLPTPSARPALPFTAASEADIPEVTADEDDDYSDGETRRPPPLEPAAAPVHIPAAAAAPAVFKIPAAWSAANFSVNATLALPQEEPAPLPTAEPPAPQQAREPTPPQAREFAPPPSPADVAPEPPPMLGPLARLEAPAAEPAAAEAAPAPPSDTPSAETPAEAAPAAELPLPVDDYPIERCARLAARVELHESEKPKILEAEGLAAETFDRLAQHWSAAVDKESLRGKSTLMRAYDTAYIGQIESERGPITITEYARLTVAMENGTIEECLTALALPRRSAMPIRRMWTHKVFKDPKLAAQVRQAVLAERES